MSETVAYKYEWYNPEGDTWITSVDSIDPRQAPLKQMGRVEIRNVTELVEK